ncbi:MAG TPA: septum formation initiator family protein [Alphaproteobacteria bacterium]|nr:septum formation initiator family protein [Alphaproteobacteria bacterium]
MQLSVFVDHLKHSLLTLLCGLMLLYFVLPGVVGERGIFAATRMRAQLAASQNELSDLKKEHEQLEAGTRLLRPDHLDLDMLDERARATLGTTKPNEYIIYYEQEAR